MLHGQIRGLYTLQYLINISCPLSKLLGRIEAVGHQSARLRIKCEWIDRRHAITRRQRDDQVAICKGNNVGRDDQADTRFGCERRKDTLDFSTAMHWEANQLLVEKWC